MKAKDILLRGDVIGLSIRIVDSPNKDLVGIEGRVVNEGKNTLEIECEGKVKKVMKKDVVFEVELDGSRYRVDGKLLLGGPEDRIKKIRKL